MYKDVNLFIKGPSSPKKQVLLFVKNNILHDGGVQGRPVQNIKMIEGIKKIIDKRSYGFLRSPGTGRRQP